MINTFPNSIISGKIFYEETTDSDIRWYEVIRKLTTVQG